MTFNSKMTKAWEKKIRILIKKKHKVKKWATEKLNGIKKGRTRATEITTTSTPTTIIKTKIWIKIDSTNDVGTRHLAKKPEFL